MRNGSGFGSPLRLPLLLALVLGGAVPGPRAAAQEFDVLIRGGTVVDGTGGPAVPADVGIVGDEIVAVGPDLPRAGAARVIDAAGRHVTPAFIDLHSHADRSMVQDDPELRRARAHVKQGIATVVGGPDGRNRVRPLAAEIETYRTGGIGLNVVPMVGHGTIREEVMGEDYERHATAGEIEEMRGLVREAMEEGAWGIGTGLEYRPGRFSHPEEVVELAHVVAEYGGFHFSHMRGSGRLPKWHLPSRVAEAPAQVAYTLHSGPAVVDGWATDAQDGIREIIEIARRTGIPSVASHVKAKGAMSWGRALNDIILVEEARAEGVPVYLDQYPYEGHSGGNGIVIPYWALVDEGVDTSGGLDSPIYGREGVFDDHRANLRRNLADPGARERLRIDTGYLIDYKGGPDRLLVTRYPDEELVGKTVAEVAELWDLTPEETIWEFSLRGFEDEPAGVFLRPYSLHPKDVELYMRQEYTATSSDGRLVSGPGLHPRHYGSFPRKIAHYVREKGVIDLPHAVRSSSGLPAHIIGLPDRGLVREGYKADLLVFELDAFRDRATALEPELYAEGLDYMLVNGVFAIDAGEFQGVLAGRVLERSEAPDRAAMAPPTGEPGSGSAFDPGTEADREALFEYLVEKTLERDAFASLGEHPLHRGHPKGIDVVAEMERYREELVRADTDEKMWFALRKISNARRDRHLGLSLVEGGLELPEALDARLAAPIHFAVDYGDPDDRFFFVADRGTRIGEVARRRVPDPGDRLVAVDGRTAREHVEAMRPFKRYSSDHALWWLVAEEISRTWDTYYGHTNHLPHEAFYGGFPDSLRLELERPDGSRYEVTLPYTDPDEIEWEGHSEREYPGFARIPELDGWETFRGAYRSGAGGPPVLIVDWLGFRGDLRDAVDALMEYAEAHDLLDHHVIVDATRARGGSMGSYAVQRFQGKPHKGTFGNLKVSDLMAEWVEERIARFHRGEGDASTLDGGAWQLEWLETDARKAIEEGRMYTNDVPFKGAHAPPWSDGIIEPAPVHFRGGLTVWLSPEGGSHLDQFAAQVVDNDLGHLVGMPTGGYSNTWSASEILRFPTTGRPIVGFEWSMGHSIRPNGELLQYNPAEPHEPIPQTRENYFDYHPRLLRGTLERLGMELPPELADR